LSAAFEGLASHHQDPFDRILIAQAIVEPMRLITHDATAALYSDSVMKI
jgi:PIN domain nuclease of toxin-antitoxin system